MEEQGIQGANSQLYPRPLQKFLISMILKNWPSFYNCHIRVYGSYKKNNNNKKKKKKKKKISV